MKNPGKIRVALLLFAIALVVPLMAFTLRGGDSFEIYIGKKLAVNFPHRDKTIKSIDISTASSTDELKVSYNHCGQTSTNRTITVRNNQQVLKEWRFSDIKAGGSTQMNIPIKDILAFQKKGKQLSLFYKSDLMKEGMVLTTLTYSSTQASIK